MFKQENELRIPKDLFEKLQKSEESGSQEEIDNAIQQILMSHMFQMLNDYPIPPKYCKHLRQMVYLTDHGYKSYRCLSCQQFLYGDII